jgi:hypothetical protein
MSSVKSGDIIPEYHRIPLAVPTFSGQKNRGITATLVIPTEKFG